MPRYSKKMCIKCGLEKELSDFYKRKISKDGIIKPNKTWDIDHIIPVSSVKTEEEIIKLNYYTNLQPLCSYVNRKVKRAKNPLNQ